ncbi:hypothetical protein ANN_19390 [Periplaneta americana]|uniref:Glucose-methanol-choline oxidoreductase N-terminal domain-containing protein n=1 Tax=Periplaneta americana TaxID=6978 RepID=A0ABQ8S9R7_PERAM|nr:hypothetical protein ANN_19390 [Periplaneta americana]
MGQVSDGDISESKKKLEEESSEISEEDSSEKVLSTKNTDIYETTQPRAIIKLMMDIVRTMQRSNEERIRKVKGKKAASERDTAHRLHCLKVTEDIREALDKGQITILTLLDYSKAFDTVDVDLLIAKLRVLYFSDNALAWMDSIFVNANSNAGWSYEDVLPYFKKSENNRDPDIYKDTRHHSRGGYLNVERFPYQDKNVPVILEAFQEIGYPIVDINSENVTGGMCLQCMQSQGARQSTNAAFITPVRQRENLKVVTNVRVTKVLIHPDTKLAYGVAYARESNRTIMVEVFAEKEVILSAGVFNSPHLLLLSGLGPRETLQTLKIQPIQNLEVGYNLQDHIMLSGIVFNVKKESQILPDDMNILEDEFLYCHDRINSPRSGNGLVQTYANVKSKYANKNTDYPDLFITFLPFLSCTQKAYPFCYYDSIRMYSVLLRPKVRHFLTINTTDPFVNPLIYTNYFSNKDDIDILIDSYSTGITLAETTAFSKAGFTINTPYIITKEDMEKGNFTPFRVFDRDLLFTANHHVGTNKIGPETDSSAVVSPELKVHGVRGLRVADASIMPRIVSDICSLKKRSQSTLLVTYMDLYRRAAQISRKDKTRNGKIREIYESEHYNFGRYNKETIEMEWICAKDDDNRTPKNVLEWIPPGKRKRGWSTTTWNNNMQIVLRRSNFDEQQWNNREERKRAIGRCATHLKKSSPYIPPFWHQEQAVSTSPYKNFHKSVPETRYLDKILS